MALGRLGIAALLALCITLGLFLLMQYLISMSEGSADPRAKGPIVDFVRLERESEVVTRKRRLPERQKPPEPPPPPELRLAQTDAPDAETLVIAAPAMDVDPNITGGLALGTGATDSDIIPIVRVRAQYPARALERGIEGWVLVEYTITTMGTVEDAVVVDSEPVRLFDRAAVRSVKKWKFKPKIVHGSPVEHRQQTKIEFDLEGG